MTAPKLRVAVGTTKGEQLSNSVATIPQRDAIDWCGYKFLAATDNGATEITQAGAWMGTSCRTSTRTSSTGILERMQVMSSAIRMLRKIRRYRIMEKILDHLPNQLLPRDETGSSDGTGHQRSR